MDFDDVLMEAGGFGRYQIWLCLLLYFCSIPPAFNNLGIVFIAGVPEHWCETPDLAGLNLTSDVIKNVTIPLEEKDGVTGYSSCLRYQRNYTGWTQEDVLGELSRNRSGDPVEKCQDGWVYDNSIYTSTIVSKVITSLYTRPDKRQLYQT